MKKFRFRLEAALRQREAVLDNAKIELNEVSQRRDLAQNLLSDRQESLLVISQQGPQVGGQIDPGGELIRQRHMHVLREEIRRREQQVDHLERLREERRLKVVEAHRDLRALEILRERDYAAWLAEFKYQEQKETDERNSARFGHSV